MAILFPSDIVPSSVNDLVPIYPSKDYTSELTQTSQHSTSETCLYELEYTFPPLTLVQYRKAKAVLHQAHHSGLIMPYYEPLENGNNVVGSLTSAVNSPSYSVSISIAAGLTIPAGSVVAIKTVNTYYLYALSTDSYSATSTRTLALVNKTRKPHSINDNVYYAPAYIQGWPTITWPQDADNNGFYNGLKVKIREDK